MKLWKITEKLWEVMKYEGKRAGKWCLRGKAKYTFSWSTGIPQDVETAYREEKKLKGHGSVALLEVTEREGI